MDEALKLDNQLCFPLYAASKEITRMYNPLLEPLNLTYTQYIVMLVLWEDAPLSVKQLGAKLFLDSGTLTPVLKKLEKKGYLERHRDTKDERVLVVNLTNEGKKLQETAGKVPRTLVKQLPLAPEELLQLQKLTVKLLNAIQE
jgi:DNA-binding MarR family transcriptional regulator